MKIEYSSEPQFVDMLAVDVVVSEQRYMKLTTAEKRHAVHRLNSNGVTQLKIAEILRITPRTVLRILDYPPPPILDINEEGMYVSEFGDVVGNAVWCKMPDCDHQIYIKGGPYGGLCKMHRDRIDRARWKAEKLPMLDGAVG